MNEDKRVNQDTDNPNSLYSGSSPLSVIQLMINEIYVYNSLIQQYIKIIQGNNLEGIKPSNVDLQKNQLGELLDQISSLADSTTKVLKLAQEYLDSQNEGKDVQST